MPARGPAGRPGAQYSSKSVSNWPPVERKVGFCSIRAALID